MGAEVDGFSKRAVPVTWVKWGPGQWYWLTRPPSAYVWADPDTVAELEELWRLANPAPPTLF